MLISELKKRLDEIAWHEQVERELSERPSVRSAPAPALIEEALRELAASVNGALFDALERENGYLVWFLRLVPFVEPAHAQERVRPYLDSTNWHVRHWARAIAGSKE